MNNEEIKKMLRELSDSADAEGRVKSRTIRISLGPEEPEESENRKKRRFPFFPLRGRDELRSAETEETEDSADPATENSADPGIAARRFGRDDSESAIRPEEEDREEDLEGDWDEGEEERVSVLGRFGALCGAAGRNASHFREKLKERNEHREQIINGQEEIDDEDDLEDVTAGKAGLGAVIRRFRGRRSAQTEDSHLEDSLPEGRLSEDSRPEEKLSEDSRLEDSRPEEKREGALAESFGKEPERRPEDGNEETSPGERPLRARKRITPVEPEDFESDADEFRSPDAPDRGDKPQGSLRDRWHAWLTMLEGRGIGRKELLMIVSGIVLMLLIITVALSVWGSHQKSRNVTADDGLTVTVEKQPGQWTDHGEVTLGIRTASPIQSITVNGENCAFTGTTRTSVQVEAQTEKLEVMVVSEQSVLNATVDLPKMDCAPPAVTLSSQNGKVTIDAQDERSGVKAVYYGVLEGFSDIPQYQLYSGPFEARSKALYVYYAVDNAGNIAGPVQTNMTPAQSISLEEESVTLFPGDTYQLQVAAVPENGFLNGLTMTSSDKSVISLEANGLISALADGEADVRISAQGLSPVTCHVTVRSQAQITISTVGDVTLGDDVNFSPLNSFTTVQAMEGNSYFFANVRAILSADDVTFANLEGTLTDQGTRADKQYAFRGDPSYTQILTEGSVEAVTLANNHSSDYGEVSLTDTEKYLNQAGIDYVNGDQIVVKEVSGVKVGLIGIYALDEGLAKESQVQQTILQAEEQGAQVIVVAFHWGTESTQSPDETQIQLAHTAIDYGADLVVGHHPHVLQGIEKYAGKYIAYSLGNFCFGGNANPSDMDTMIFQETFTISRDQEEAEGEVKIIPCSISSDSTWNNYQPTPATGTQAQSIMEKINERSAQFGTEPFTYDG